MPGYLGAPFIAGLKVFRDNERELRLGPITPELRRRRISLIYYRGTGSFRYASSLHVSRSEFGNWASVAGQQTDH